MNSSIDPKKQAKLLEFFLKEKNIEVSHSTCLHAIAVLHGIKNWNTMKTIAPKTDKIVGVVSPDENSLQSKIEDLEQRVDDCERANEYYDEQIDKLLKRVNTMEPWVDECLRGIDPDPS